MATATFVGTGTIYGKFTIDGAVTSRSLIKGEFRLQTPLPPPALDGWRRQALSFTSTIPAWDTRGRTVVLFAHEADLGSVFFDLTGVAPSVLAGFYQFKQKSNLADTLLTPAYADANRAMAELQALGVPGGHRALLTQRLESSTFNHRVAALCATVYLASILLEEAEAT